MQRISFILCLLLALTSCGFTPLYAVPAQNARATTTSDELRYVEIDQIRDRIGQELRNALLATLPPAAGSSKYKLMVTLQENIDDFGIRRDTTATFARLTVTAQFVLKNIADEKVILNGTARAGNSYNILQSTFATLSAEEDARTRSTQQLA
jgi:LPS-assembly lipoprotein